MVVQGDSGRTNTILETLVERRKPLPGVYRARYAAVRPVPLKILTAGSNETMQYIVKNQIAGDSKCQTGLQKPLEDCTNVRTVVDKPTTRSFRLPLPSWRSSPAGPSRKSDVEEPRILGTFALELGLGRVLFRDSWYVPFLPGRDSSPSSLIVSQMVYVLLNKMVFRVSDAKLQTDDSLRPNLRQHMSYLADEDGVQGLLQHIGVDNAFSKVTSLRRIPVTLPSSGIGLTRI